jgi:hypothetical protein
MWIVNLQFPATALRAPLPAGLFFNEALTTTRYVGHVSCCLKNLRALSRQTGLSFHMSPPQFAAPSLSNNEIRFGLPSSSGGRFGSGCQSFVSDNCRMPPRPEVLVRRPRNMWRRHGPASESPAQQHDGPAMPDRRCSARELAARTPHLTSSTSLGLRRVALTGA